ncbi:MAG TPA: putative sugar nucleotidyl transferase [Phycisphaerae bacterium]|nr:putative sugar nucleotidyl transferase [Phycisphaerae bacterium]
MSSLILFEDARWVDLLPMVYWRSVFELIAGRKTLLDNAAVSLGRSVDGVWMREWIADVGGERCQIPANQPVSAGDVLVNGRWLINESVEFHEAPFIGVCGDDIVYISCDENLAKTVSPAMLCDEKGCAELKQQAPTGEVEAALLRYPWDITSRNRETLCDHWKGDDRSNNGDVSSSAFMINPDQIHIGEKSVVKPTAVIDADGGPVFISNNVIIDVHTYIEGPVYIGPGSHVKPHTAIRSGTTLGAMCKVAGEISASIFCGYGNKGHHGFIGDAYIGSWVNLGAGTTNSNLKNTYGDVKVQLGPRQVSSGLQFLGSTVGDFARLGIGQLLPTGAVVGMGAMIATGGLAPKFVPSFAWQTADGRAEADLEKTLHTAKVMMSRRNADMSEPEETLFRSNVQRSKEFGV